MFTVISCGEHVGRSIGEACAPVGLLADLPTLLHRFKAKLVLCPWVSALRVAAETEAQSKRPRSSRRLGGGGVVCWCRRWRGRR